ncbi:hypothetical protein DFH06DRAFT_1330357 [Mycena polygramma]|nr:hypothetical protein DFH06DRAFT_1330357 [Mycena polygramma]
MPRNAKAYPGTNLTKAEVGEWEAGTCLYILSRPPHGVTAFVPVSEICDLRSLRGNAAAPASQDSYVRARSGAASSKGNKSILSFIFSTHKRLEIIAPCDPAHITRVGFNSSTDEFTVCPSS